MPTYTFDFRKSKPVTGGQRQDYIKPGSYRLKIVAYSDKESANGKEMHSYTFEVKKGDQAGKKLIERFVMPKTAKDSTFGLDQLYTLLLAVGAKVEAKQMKLDPGKLVGKEVDAEITDEEQPERKEGDRVYKARTVSRIYRFILDDDEDEDDDDEEDDEEEEEDDEDDDDEEEEDEDEEEEDDEDEEEEEPAPKKKSSKASAPKAKSKARAKAAPAKGKKKAKADVDDDDDDFPFDD